MTIPRLRGAMIISRSRPGAGEAWENEMVHWTKTNTDVLRSWGANVIRWQLTNWNAHNLTIPEYNAWLQTELNILDKFLETNPTINIILDMHTPVGGFIVHEGLDKKLLGDTTTLCCKKSEFNLLGAEFIRHWGMIAERYKNATQIVGYDLINEPGFRKRHHKHYRKLMTYAAEAVREHDTQKVIIVESRWGIPSQFKHLLPIKSMPDIWYSTHFYEPGFITYQGIGPNGTLDPSTIGKKKYPTKKIDRAHLRKTVNPVVKFQQANNCRIYVGEFGCTRFSGGDNHPFNAKNWLSDCISLWESLGWDWTYHAFRESHVWDQELTRHPTAPVRDTENDRINVIRAGFSLNE